MAKKRSLFDDSHDREIQELTGIIRHDLTSLTKQLGDLRNRSRVASPAGNNAHLQKHSTNLVGSLQTKVAFITQMFKDVLEVRTEVSSHFSWQGWYACILTDHGTLEGAKQGFFL